MPLNSKNNQENNQSSKYIFEMTDRSTRMLYWLKKQGLTAKEETIREMQGRMLDTPILVVMDPTVSQTFEGQVILQMLTNQLVRSCFNVSFIIPKVPLIVPITILSNKNDNQDDSKPKTLDKEIVHMSESINIFGEFRSLLETELEEINKANKDKEKKQVKKITNDEFQMVFIVGRSNLKEILLTITNQDDEKIRKKYQKLLQIPNKYWIASYGWNSYVNKEYNNFKKLNKQEFERLFSSTNPMGALLAPTIALNDGLKKLLRINKVSFISNKKMLKFAIFDYFNKEDNKKKNSLLQENPALPKEILLEITAIIGAGAIGGALIYLLPFFNYSDNQFSLSFKELILVDDDSFELSNLNRVLFTDYKSVGKKKVKLAKKYLENNNFNNNYDVQFKITTIENLFENINEEIEDFNLTAIVTVDTIRARQAIQKKLPKSIINLGSKEFTFELSIQRDLLTDPCLLCFYPEELSDFELLSRQIALKRKIEEFKTDSVDLDNEKSLTNELSEENISKVRLEIINHTKKGLRLDEAAALVAGYKTINYPNITNHLTELLGIEPNVPTLAPISVFPAILAIAEMIKQKYFPREFHLDNKWQTNLLQFPKIKGISLKQAKREECWCQGKYVKKLYFYKYKTKY